MPSREKESPSLYSAAVEELVAIGAAIACNCEPCFKHHFREALGQGSRAATWPWPWPPPARSRNMSRRRS